MRARTVAGMEVAVLQPDIDIVADRVISVGQQLPREVGTAAAELVHPGIAQACTDTPAESAVSAEIEPSIEHRVPDVSRLVDSEVGVVGHNQPVGDQVIEERRIELLPVNLSVLVADLALKPEHAEIITSDEVDIDPSLVLDPTDIG